MSRFFFLRHGESSANVAGLIASAPANAAAAYGLTPRGRDQVRRAVENARAAGELAGVQLVFSSPLLRALESASIAAEVLGAEIHVDPRLIERGFGSLELSSDHNYEQVWGADRIDPTHEQWGVESVASVLARVHGLFVEREAEAQPGPLLLCTHGDVASVALCAGYGQPIGTHRDVGALANGEIRGLPAALP